MPSLKEELLKLIEEQPEDSPQAALRTIQGIRQRVLPLTEFPEMGHRYQDSERHVRILLHGQYQIPYLVHDNRDVTILGAFHGSMDITRFEF